MPKNKRSPRLRTPNIVQGERVRVSEATDDRHPIWCFRHLDPEWGLARLDARTSSGLFLSALYARSQLSWNDIAKAARTGLGWEKGNDLKFAPSIPSIAASKTLYVFRIQGNNGRFVGFREGSTFRVIFVDPDFDLYKH